MGRIFNANRRDVLKSRTLRFESLESREMLDVAPIGFLSSTSNVACFSNAVPEQYGAIELTDLSTGAPLSNGDALQFDSYSIDSSGYALDPSYGETVYKRIVVQNTGTETLTITSATLSEGSRVLNRTKRQSSPLNGKRSKPKVRRSPFIPTTRISRLLNSISPVPFAQTRQFCLH